MTTSSTATDALQRWSAVPNDVTIKDVERFNQLLEIFGDPRQRVDVSVTQRADESSIEIPASSRFQFSTW